MGLFLPLHDDTVFALSTRSDGSMRVGNGSFLEGMANRQKFIAALGVGDGRLVTAGLDHGNRVAMIGCLHGGQVIDGVDGLVTDEPNIVLAVTAADCLPIAFYDPTHRVTGLVHAGWKGLQAGVIQRAVFFLKQCYGIDPAGLFVTIGPGIGPCHYPIGGDIADYFRKIPHALHQVGASLRLDVRTVAMWQLSAEGVPTNQVSIDPRCTFETAEFYSLRRDGEANRGAMLAILGLTTAFQTPHR